MGSTYYPSQYGSVNSIPLRGKYLSRTPRTPRECDFLASDLYRGVFHLVEPSLVQAAFIAGSHSVTAVWWAVRREEHRGEILNGELPLMPARLVAPKTNGTALVVPKAVEIDDSTVIDFVRTVGITRVLEAAVAVEAAQ